MSQGEGGGRPTAYRASYVKIAQAIMRLGGTDREVAHALSIDEATLNRWKLRHPKFCASIKVGKNPSDKRVEVSLYKKSVGYSYDTEELVPYDHIEEREVPDPADPKKTVKVIVREKRVLRVPTVTHVPPSDRAIEYWLNNRQRKKWKTRQALDLSSPPGRPMALTYTPGEPELLQDYYAKIAQAAAAADPDPRTAPDLGQHGPEREEPERDPDAGPR